MELTPLILIPAAAALGALAITALAEWLHTRRINRVARLAFGPDAAPAFWARSAPILRCIGATAVAWGATTLLLYDPVPEQGKHLKTPTKQLLICLDVSPSMQLKDAGPGPEKVTRAVWAGKLAQAILDRLDADTTRVTLCAFYTKVLPIVQETFDKEVIRNALDGLPMYIAFDPGATDMHMGVSKTLEFARAWPAKSTMFVVISDGDTSANRAPLRIPDSIAESVVIGVGDPTRSTTINGHSSRQDTASLQQLAARLGGRYHEGNTKHLPSNILETMAITAPDSGLGIDLRGAALLAIGVGGGILALLGPALLLFGRKRSFRRERLAVVRRNARGTMVVPALTGTQHS